MSPFADAVSFVDCNPRKLPLFVYDPKKTTEPVKCAILWRDVEKS